jgi:hypothetical protein
MDLKKKTESEKIIQFYMKNTGYEKKKYSNMFQKSLIVKGP